MSKRQRLPIVALVGRPNVGKSRLFNRFVGSRKALVENTPGVTRDRNYGTAKWDHHQFTVIDTGGFEPDSNDILLEQMRVQAQLAVEEADVIVFVVDSRAGLLPADWQIADILRKSSKRVILAVNKIDQPKLIDLSYEFYELAFEELIAISAEHGLGFSELADAVTRDFPTVDDDSNKHHRFELDNDFGEFTEEYVEQFGEYPKGYEPSEDDEFEDDYEMVDGERVQFIPAEDGDESEFNEADEESDVDADNENDVDADDEMTFVQTEEDYEDFTEDEEEDLNRAHTFESEDDAELYEVPATARDENSLEERVLNETISVAVLGKPNTGKSTLINRLLGYKRLLTADIAGTTRDTIDTELEGKDGQQFLLIDTAGIRRKCTISQRIEKFSIVKALDAVERADIVLIVIDARVGATDQDLKIAQIAIEKGCAIAVLLNKWDLIEGKTDQTATEYIKDAKEKFSFIEHVPVFTISALTGTRTHKILDIAKKLYIQASVRVPTGELNRVFRRILADHNPPTVGSRTLKFYFAQQVAIRPPTFVIQSNAPEIIPSDYKRYIINQIRRYYGFAGTPIRILFKKPAGRRKWTDKK